MKLRKKITILIATSSLATSLAFAETCPVLDGKKFNNIWEYNAYKNSVASQYSMEDMSAMWLSFPITFGKTEYIVLQANSDMSLSAPYVGDKVECTVSYTANNFEQQDSNITINHKVKTTSNDWDEMDTQTAECQNPNGPSTCTFDRIN